MIRAHGRLCARCAEERPGSEPMTPGMPMVPVDLVRNLVIDHFASEESMIRAHGEYWRPLEAKYGHNTPELEHAFTRFLQKRDVEVPTRWALYAGFIQWW